MSRKHTDKAIITGVEKGSIAEEVGIEPGDLLKSINGQNVSDMLAYRFLSADDYLLLEVVKPSGELWEIDVEKEPDEPLGLIFSDAVFDKIKTCCNKCVFCFIDQMPAGLRNSLYVKDDDFRTSFLHGSYISLTNLTKTDLNRILSEHISPLYISVHSTDPETRSRLMGVKKAGKSLSLLDEFARANIQMHIQIVLCPGINDGKSLDKTLSDLVGLYPHLQSIAVVPVGLTEHREGLAYLNPVSADVARETISIVSGHQRSNLEKYSSRLVFLADEFYFLADHPLPEEPEYEGYPQLEDGIGVTTLLRTEFLRYAGDLPSRSIEQKNIYFITSKLGEKAIKPILERINQIENINAKPLVVKNNFFGENITVTGLLVGKDIRNAIIEAKPRGLVIIPSNTLKHGEAVFLDDLSLADLECSVDTRIKVVEPDARAIISIIKEEAL